MRKTALVFGVLLLAAASAAEATQLLGARSEHHELRLDRTALPADRVSYHVTLIDLDRSRTVLDSELTGAAGQPVEARSTPGLEQFRVRLAYTPTFFSATVTVLRADTIVDEFRTWWQLEPRAPQRELDAAGAYRVGGDVKAPVMMNRVEPKYTPEARARHISGIVVVEAVVGKDGRVKDAVVLKPLPFGLSEAALDAVRQSTFRPGTLNGQPVDVIFSLTVNFKTDSPPPPQP